VLHIGFLLENLSVTRLPCRGLPISGPSTKLLNLI
jgi:hypothetical protein